MNVKIRDSNHSHCWWKVSLLLTWKLGEKGVNENTAYLVIKVMCCCITTNNFIKHKLKTQAVIPDVETLEELGAGDSFTQNEEFIRWFEENYTHQVGIDLMNIMAYSAHPRIGFISELC